MSEGGNNGMASFSELVSGLLYRQIILRDLLGKVAPGLLALFGILGVFPPERTLSAEMEDWLHNPLIALPLGWILGLALQQLGEMTGAFWRGPLPSRLLFMPASGKCLAAEQARQFRHALFTSGRNRDDLGASVGVRTQLAAFKEIAGGFALASLVVAVCGLVHGSERFEWIGGAAGVWILLWLAHMSLANRQAKYEVVALRIADLISSDQMRDMETATADYFYPTSGR